MPQYKDEPAKTCFIIFCQESGGQTFFDGDKITHITKLEWLFLATSIKESLQVG
jgi:hypothetical protein